MKQALTTTVVALLAAAPAAQALDPAAVSALCTGAASQKEGSGDPAAVAAAPYWLFFRTERHLAAGWSRLPDDPAYSFVVPSDQLRPPQEPKLVICVDEKQRDVGSYKAAPGTAPTKTRSNAYELDWRVNVVRLADRKVLSSKLLTGGAPPKELNVPYPTLGYGEQPKDAFRDWILSFRTDYKVVKAPGAVRAIAVSPDGSRVAVGFGPKVASDPQEHGVDVLDAATGNKLSRLPHSTSVEDVAFSPDGSMLASIASDGVVSLWDFSSSTLARSFPSQSGTGGIVRFSPDGKVIASAGSGGSLQVWDASAGREVASVSPGCAVADVAFSPHSDMLATAGCGRVKVWDASSLKELRILEHVHSADAQAAAPEIGAVAFSDGGRVLLSAGTGYGGVSGKDVVAQLRVWNAGTGQPLHTLNARSRGAYGRLAVLPDHQVAASDGGDIDVWDFDAGRVVRQLGGHAARIKGLDGYTGSHLVSGGLDGFVAFWDLGQRNQP